MEQIYYTQCPVGYGLGASNGFQIKRKSPGYPVSGDFRHLGIRAFPGGGRVQAPPSLRYRKDGDIAEVAWLTPRPNEYETERGLWGRPGGHFAHGIRLEEAEFHAIRRWPAGLFDGPAWRRSDREPSRGRLPEPVDWSSALSRPPTFADVAPMADGEDPDQLATLMTAIARVAGKGQTLFLIDEPARLGPRIALLTFAFPEAFRGDLTFSTYHDRPEELPGYRIQGTIAAARPNRSALTALGIVVDAVAGTSEPRVEPARWARTLAGWLTRHDPIDEADWSATSTRAREARRPEPPESVWDDAWLDSLFAYPEAQRSKATPTDPEGWAALADFAGWLDKTGLGGEWLRSRNAGWWLASFCAEPEARAALVAHAGLPEAWAVEGEPAAWGVAVAAWTRDVDPADRDRAIAAILGKVPRKVLPAFARALLRGLTPEGASAVLDRLRADPGLRDRGTLKPLEAGAAAAEVLGGASPSKLSAIVEGARVPRGLISAVLDALASVVEDRPEGLPMLASASAVAFDLDGPDGGREALAWALRRGKQASTWLKPSLRPILVDPDRIEVWKSLPGRAPDSARPELARAVLEIASGPGMPDEAFRWGVEELLLPLAPRPHDPTWAETYLHRTPSDLDLIRRLFTAESKKIGIPKWIAQAQERGEVSPEQAARIEKCRAFALMLKSGDPASLLAVAVPDVPPGERGALLGQMLFKVGGDGSEGLPYILHACRSAWPGAFEPGAAGLKALASPLAQFLARAGRTPEGWLEEVGAIVGHLDLGGSGLRGFEPDGLAAEVAAASAAMAGRDPWPLRRAILRDRSAWRILTADARRDLAQVLASSAAIVLEEWDRRLDKSRPEEFFAAFLNACDGPRLAASVASKADALKTLPPLPWWGHARHPGAVDDLRDGYARIAPLAPLPDKPEGRLRLVRNWVVGNWVAPADRAGATPPGLSSEGLARWRCLEALTNLRQGGQDAQARWKIVDTWEKTIPLAGLSADDRHRFVAWFFLMVDSAESYQVDRVAKWFSRSGVDDADRLTRWAQELDGLVEVSEADRIARLQVVGDFRRELHTLIQEARGTRRPRAADRNST